MQKENLKKENQSQDTEPCETKPQNGFQAMIKQGEAMEEVTKTKKQLKKASREKNKMTPEKQRTAIKMALEGQTGPLISQGLGISFNAFRKFKSANHAFRKEYEQARRDGAEIYETKMRSIAENTKGADEVPVSKFKFDAFERLAAINDPERYGKKVGKDGNASQQPVTIIFKTGIDRSPEREVTSKPVDVLPDKSKDKP